MLWKNADFRCLSHRFQHILYKDPITSCRIVYKNVSHRTDELAVLDNVTAVHE